MRTAFSANGSTFSWPLPNEKVWAVADMPPTNNSSKHKYIFVFINLVTLQ